MVPLTHGIAFSVEPEAFMAFVRSLPNGIPGADGGPLTAGDLVDFDLCWAIDFSDPWGNRYELNCYAYDRVRRELVEADGLTPGRKWPRDLYDAWRAR